MRPWMLIAGVAALALVALAGGQLANGERCADPPGLYGEPPAGWSYTPQPATDNSGDDVRVARRAGTKTVAYLIAVPVQDQDGETLDAYLAQAADTTVTNEGEINGRDVVRAAPGEGGRVVAGLKACHVVQVLSADPRVAEELARAVF
ncbi:hypothetical protein OJ998_16130 [Solirubrobacter taibaiensis]|nr:hypothetical protein [Solirubrobacter taibaiensis]